MLDLLGKKRHTSQMMGTKVEIQQQDVETENALNPGGCISITK